ncbi:MAG: thiamine diphosphokinase [Ilumatobacteraceae bacterium]
MPHDKFAQSRSSARDSSTAGLTAFVIVGGDPLPPPVVAAVTARCGLGETVMIAADSGLDHALTAGFRPDIVVGDFDSVSVAALHWARTNDIDIDEHPPAKDDTDTELALATAISRGATDIVMISGGGDRLDHSIGALTALGHPSLARLRSVSALWSDSTIHVLHGPRSLEIELPTGTTFSLLALHGRCTGVGEVGAQWPLDDAVIEPASSRGISNVSIAETVTVSVATGIITIIVPAHTVLAGQS